MRTPGVELFETLIAAAESRSLSEAAEKLKISQPGVSVKLQALERLAPLPLFSLEGKRKVLTHYGRELYKIARTNQTQLEKSYEELNRRYASPSTLTLRVGCRKELFQDVCHKFRFAGRIEFTSLSSSDAVDALMSNKIDIAIAYGDLLPDSPEIMAKKILESVTEFAVHRKLLPRKLSDALTRDREFLTGTPCVHYVGGGHALTDWTRHLGIPAEKLKVAAVAEDWNVLLTLIGQGWGYGIIPGHIKGSSAEVARLPMLNSVLTKYTFFALFRKDLRKVPAFQKLLEFK
jgi:DNA-binding transcriptional LysR family regulator